MATISVAGPSALSLCKPPPSHCLYSSLPHSHLIQKWVPPLSLFKHPKHANKPFYRSGHSLFICWGAKFYLGQPLMLSAAYKGFRKQGRRRLVKASLFGVGAPEALVIGVVALLVFGPKGLAEVARTLGKSLRAFQPTIRELQEVSREFKNTLEQEIGLDELRSPNIDPSQSASQRTEPEKMEQNGPPRRKAYSTEDYLRVTDEEIKSLAQEEKPKAAEGAESGSSSPATISPKQSSEDGKTNNDKSCDLGKMDLYCRELLSSRVIEVIFMWLEKDFQKLLQKVVTLNILSSIEGDRVVQDIEEGAFINHKGIGEEAIYASFNGGVNIEVVVGYEDVNILNDDKNHHEF